MPAHSSSVRKTAKGGMNSMPMRPRRKRVEQTPEMIRANQAMIADYMKNNPDVKADLTGIRQPLVDLKNRCGAAPAPAVP